MGVTAIMKKNLNISPGLTPKKALTLMSLMRNGRISDSDLMKVLGLGSANAASYYRKHLEDQGIIKKYGIDLDWSRLGYPTHFIVQVEGKDLEANYDMEKDFLDALEEYRKENGDLFILPSGSGRVIIEDVFSCFGERPMSIIRGRATSEQDALTYSRYYIGERFPEVKITFLLVKGNSIKDFFIQEEYIDIMKGSFIEDKSISLPEEFKKRFPSLSRQGSSKKND